MIKPKYLCFVHFCYKFCLYIIK